MVNKHILEEFFRFLANKWKEQKQTYMAIAENMLKNIALFSVNISKQQWNVNKMKSPYDIRFPIVIQVIHKKDKVCYFNNINIISLM